MSLNQQQINDILTKSKQSGMSRDDAKMLLQRADSRSGGSSLASSYQKPEERKSLSRFIGNVGESGGRLISDTANAITHPIDTAKGIYNLGSGVISKFIPGRQKSEDTADAVGQFYKNRYGSMKNIGNTLYNDPIGALADVSTVVSGVGAGANLLGKTGTASKIAKVSRLTDPLQVAGSAVKATTRPLSKFFPSIAKNLPKADDLVVRGVGNPNIQKEMIVPAEKIIPKYNLWERTPEAVQGEINKLNTKRTGAIKTVGVAPNLQDLIKPLDEAIFNLKNDKLAMNSDLAVGQLKEMVRRRKQIMKTFSQKETTILPKTPGRKPKGYIPELESTNLNPKTPLSEYDAFKRKSLDPDIPEGAFAQELSQNKPKDAGGKTVRKAIAGKVDELAGTKEMGKDLQSLYKLRDVFEGYQKRVKNRQTLNFSKMGGAGIGGILSGAKGVVTGFLIEQIVNSPKGLELMYKVAKGVEKGAFGKKLGKATIISQIEKELAKYNLPDTTSIAKMIYNYGKVGRMTNND